VHLAQSPESSVPISLFPNCASAGDVSDLLFSIFFEIPAVFYLALWFFTQLFSGTMALAGPQQVGGIAWWAHIGGFVVGMLSCWFFVKKTEPPNAT